MAIGERIHFFRNKRGLTQKALGRMIGFSETTADIRIAQYESGTRTPKAQITESLANALDVSPLALSVPDIDSYLGLMHTLFTLEDRYGLNVGTSDGEVCLKVDIRKNKDAARLHEMLCEWSEVSGKYHSGEISREEYDRWRYRYPEMDKGGHYKKVVPSQGMSDLLLMGSANDRTTSDF